MEAGAKKSVDLLTGTNVALDNDTLSTKDEDDVDWEDCELLDR